MSAPKGLEFDIQLGNNGGTAGAEVICTGLFGVHPAAGKLMVKASMFAIPLVFIVAGYVIYLKKYKISEEYYANILKDLQKREEA